MEKHFNKDLFMSEEEEQFQPSNICWICEKLNDDDNEIRDHCHMTRKFRGAAHWSCSINLQLTKKFLVVFHNLRGYGHLIFDQLKNFDVKIDKIPKYIKKMHGISLK